MKDLIEKYLSEAEIDEDVITESEVEELLESLTDEELEEILEDVEEDSVVDSILEEAFNDDEEEVDEIEDIDEDDFEEIEESEKVVDYTNKIIDGIIKETDSFVENIENILTEGVKLDFNRINEDIVLVDDEGLEALKEASIYFINTGDYSILDEFLESCVSLSEAGRFSGIAQYAKSGYTKAKGYGSSAAKYAKSGYTSVKSGVVKGAKAVSSGVKKVYTLSRDAIRKALVSLRNWRIRSLAKIAERYSKRIDDLTEKLKNAKDATEKTKIGLQIKKINGKIKANKEAIEKQFQKRNKVKLKQLRDAPSVSASSFHRNRFSK